LFVDSYSSFQTFYFQVPISNFYKIKKRGTETISALEVLVYPLSQISPAHACRRVLLIILGAIENWLFSETKIKANAFSLQYFKERFLSDFE